MRRIAIIGMVILLTCLINPVQADSVYTGDKGIISEGPYVGCTDKEEYFRMREYGAQNDKQAFQTALRKGMMQGTVTVFKEGDIVYCVDEAIGSGLIKVQREGDTTAYWTRSGAVSKLPE